MRESGGVVAAVPPGQPPQPDMPPLELMILDALVDDAETIYTMQSCGEMVPDGLALVGEQHLLDALRSLLAAGLVEVEMEYVFNAGQVSARRVTAHPGTTDDDLRRYWFCLTPTGLKAWEAAGDILDAYWAAHPSTPRIHGEDPDQT